MTDLPYPRFLGVDDSGDFVWLLADGRWTWGSDPYDAACRGRTFEPERFTEKYGAPTALADLPTRLRNLRPESVTPQPSKPERPARIDTGGRLGDAGERGAYRALRRFLDVLDGWVEGARSNHDALDHRGEMEPCWETFHADDIRNMVNDAAREVRVPEPWSKEDKA